MKFEVFVTADAESDIDGLYAYIAEVRSKEDADHVKARLLEAIEQLEAFPDRGPLVRELREAGTPAFREVFFKPYRVIYRVLAPRVYVYVVTDGRRDLRSLLIERLTR